MATTTRVPTGEGTTIEWTPLSGTDNALMVDEGVDTHDSDTTYVSENSTKGQVVDFYDIQDMPADFDTSNTFTLRGAYKQAGWVDDSLTVRLTLYESNETTVIGTNIGDTSHPTSYTVWSGQQSNGANKATWDTRKIRLYGLITASGMADGIVVYCTAVEVVIDYNTAGNVTVTPPTASLVTSLFVPVLKLGIIPGVLALSTSGFVPVVGWGIIPASVALNLATFAPTITTTQNQLITPPTAALTTTAFVPVVRLAVIPGAVSLTTSTFAPVVGLSVIPGVLALTTSTFIPQLRLGIVPGVAALTLSTFAPSINVGVVVTPPPGSLVTTAFIPQINLAVIPGTIALTLTTFAPQANLAIVPGVINLTTSAFAPVIALGVIPGAVSLSLTAFAPAVNLAIVPGTAALATTGFAPVLGTGVIPSATSLALSVFAPQVNLEIIPGTATLTITAFAPTVSVGGSQVVTPDVLSLSISTFAPSASTTKVAERTIAAGILPRIFSLPQQILDIELRERIYISASLSLTVESFMGQVHSGAMVYEQLGAFSVETETAAHAQMAMQTDFQVSIETCAVAIDFQEEREEQTILQAIIPGFLLTYAVRPEPQRDEERFWLDRMRRFFGEQLDRILAVAGLGAIADDFWEREQLLMTIVVQDALSRTANRAGLSVVRDFQRRYRIGVDWGLVNIAAQDWASSYSGELVKGITDTTKAQVRRAIADWIESGDPLRTLENRLLAEVGIARRAQLIASTETTRAFAKGNSLAWTESGIVNREEWRTVADERVCPICLPLDNKQNRRVGGDFPGGYYPPAHVACRCFTVPVVRGTR